MNVLWFISKRIGRPGFSIVRPLKFNLVPRACHDREKSELIGDAKRFERTDGGTGQRRVWEHHEDKKRRGRIENPGQEYRLDTQTDVCGPASNSILCRERNVLWQTGREFPIFW